LRLSDRPLLNGILGVVCALVVLGLLSWPGLVGPARGSPVLEQNFGSTSTPTINAGGLASSSSTSLPVSTPASSSSSSPAQSSVALSSSEAIPPTKSNLSTLVSGSSNSPVYHGSSVGANSSYGFANNSAADSTNTTVMAQTDSEVGPVVSTVSIQATTDSRAASTVSAATQSAKFAGGGSAIETLGTLTVASVVVAAGSMLLVLRRVRREEEQE